MKDSVSIIIPAYNEEKNIAAAVENVVDALKSTDTNNKLIIVDDGSTDSTAKIIKGLSKKYKNIQAVRNDKNIGLGGSFRKVIKKLNTKYITVFPGDNDMSGSSLADLVKIRKSADLITAYMTSDNLRSIWRRLISKVYVVMVNTLFGLNLKYFNGPFICKTSSLSKIKLRSNGLDIYAEAKIKMLKNGASFKEITFDHIGRKRGSSNAVSVKSIIRTIKNTLYLLRDINLS